MYVTCNAGFGCVCMENAFLVGWCGEMVRPINGGVEILYTGRCKQGGYARGCAAEGTF